MIRFLVAAAGALLLSLLSCLAHAKEPESLSQIFKRVDDSVVVVRISERVLAQVEGNARMTMASGIGSGVLISADGKVLTAAHVVQTADEVVVEFPENVLIRARVVASDPAADVSLLQLERMPEGIQPAKLGNSDQSEVGDQVFVVGAPLGISHTLTVGHLSARRRPNATFGSMEMSELFQTDAAINQGNSGGPMFNMKGEVIGIVSHIISRSGGSEGLGFVVTSNMARRLLLDQASVWSGLEGFLLTDKLAHALNASHAGVLVQRVAKGSPAEKFGLRGGSLPALIGEEQLILGGDVILAVEGISLATQGAYEAIRRHLIEARAAAGSIHLTVLRDGDMIELVGAVDD